MLSEFKSCALLTSSRLSLHSLLECPPSFRDCLQPFLVCTYFMIVLNHFLSWLYLVISWLPTFISWLFALIFWQSALFHNICRSFSHFEQRFCFRSFWVSHNGHPCLLLAKGPWQISRAALSTILDLGQHVRGTNRIKILENRLYQSICQSINLCTSHQPSLVIISSG